ncbi:MAG: DUF4340 domain-containing protein [Lachnospiraceae bacterium]|jgi:hypothetical protein|nr:DUF4340 domain-containing protein [Lachnospiraceae bacterium]
MKRFKRLYVLSGVLAVICGVTFLVSRYERRREEIKNSDEIILALAADDVTALSWEYDETKLAFHKDETWLYDADEAFPVSEEKMKELLGVFESFGVSFVIENVEDYDQYGLEEPTCSIHIETAEESYEVELGGYSTMDEKRYLSIGDGNVYLVSADPMETYEIELKDMILHDETPDVDQVDDITFAGSENYSIIYQEESDATYHEEDVYFVSGENGYLPLDTDTVKGYLSSIGSLGLVNYVSYNATEEELAAYGLNEPELTATIQYTTQKEDREDSGRKTFVLHVSRSAEEKAKVKEEESSEETDTPDGHEPEAESVPAYVRIGDSRIIYEITETEYESLMAASYDELRHQEVFWADFSKVTQVDISLEGQTCTLTSKEDGEETVWSYEGETIAIDDFRNALAYLKATEFTEDKIYDKEEISLTLYLNDDNFKMIHIGLYRQDGNDCLAVVDGEPTAFVARSEVVDLVEAVNAIILN